MNKNSGFLFSVIMLGVLLYGYLLYSVPLGTHSFTTANGTEGSMIIKPNASKLAVHQNLTIHMIVKISNAEHSYGFRLISMSLEIYQNSSNYDKVITKNVLRTLLTGQTVDVSFSEQIPPTEVGNLYLHATASYTEFSTRENNYYEISGNIVTSNTINITNTPIILNIFGPI